MLTTLFWKLVNGLAIDVLLKLIGDVLLMMIGRINWRVVIERLLSRMLAKFLAGLKNLKSNNLAASTVIDILEQLQAAGLPKAQ